MALRIRQSVVRGEIDNRRRGRVEGWITLVGVERPLTLELFETMLAASAEPGYVVCDPFVGS